MADDLLETLMRFHREVMVPDIERVITPLRDEMRTKFDEINSHFDDVYARFDRLERSVSGLHQSKV